ncbi:hypothetical protein [Piscinibacter sakaiensis]|uniref:hypothetical protein n=1 Tax=Piscinibacter sakaiensis TaxID=1547922 RepID=UPI003AAD465F
MFTSYSEAPTSRLRADAPPAALRLFGQVGSTLRRAGGAVWHHLEDIGQARAEREIRLLALRWSVIDPELGQRLLEGSRIARPQASREVRS